MIYSSIPNQNYTTTVEDRAKTLIFLVKHKDFITAYNLSLELGYKAKGTSVTIRKIITELIEFDNQPIISTSKGYRIAKTKEEVETYLESLQHRKKGLQRRINAVELIINNFGKRK